MAAKTKVRRAETHLSELRREVGRFLRERPFESVVRAAGPGRLRLVYQHKRCIPTDISAMIGDVVHNLRASLDVLACELVRINNPGDPAADESVYFPFCENAADLDYMIKRRRMDRASPVVIDEIKRLMPYRGGNSALRAIHDMDIADKHKTLVPVAGLANFGDAVFGPKYGAHIKIPKGANFGADDGFSQFEFPEDGTRKPGDRVKTKFSLVFAPLDPFGGQEITVALQSLTDLVKGIIEKFETICFPAPSP